MWQTTVNSGPSGQSLAFKPKHSRYFKSRESADEYADKLFEEFAIGDNYVHLLSPEIFGKEVAGGGWSGFGENFPSRSITYKNGKVTEIR